MSKYFSHIISFLYRISIVFLAFTLCRIIFYLFNSLYFEDVDLFTFIYGIRFDASAIFWIFLPFIVLSIIPIPIHHKKWYQRLLKSTFFILNTACILFNCVDIEYFKFTAKRTTMDIVNFIATGNDFALQVPKMLLDYWYFPVIALLLIILSQWLYGLLDKSIKVEPIPKKKMIKWIFVQLPVVLFLSTVIVIGARGGLQHRPINIIHASSFGSPLLAPIILNTPFTIIKTINEEALTEYQYFEEDETQPFQLIKNLKSDTIVKPNLFLIILESMSTEYTSLDAKDSSLTPFLDSLMGLGLNFTNCYANGKKSIEGIPAIIAGLPTLMNDPFISSNYSGNNINSLASLLREKGYSTNFYHGGFNGTMGFDAFCKLAGYENYIGKTEYDNEEDYDGQWGIFDAPFFKYTVEETSSLKEPFFNTLFSLSNHHPFKIPKHLQEKFKEEELEIYKTVRYTDFALAQFFRYAQKTDWYEETIFIITSDHSAPSSMLRNKGIKTTYQVPLMIFGAPVDTVKKIDHIVSQIDILPNILTIMKYEGIFNSFGSLLDHAQPKISIHFINNCYEVFYENYLLRFDGENIIGIYNLEVDSKLENDISSQIYENIKSSKRLKIVLNLLKSMIEQYNYCLIHNELVSRELNGEKENIIDH